MEEMIVKVLEDANSPLRPVEVSVAMLEAGFDMEDDPTATVGEVLRVMRDRPDCFRESDGYWKLR